MRRPAALRASLCTAGMPHRRGAPMRTGVLGRQPAGRTIPMGRRRAPPTLGEGTREVLQNLLSLSDEQLQALQAQGVLTLPEAR